METPDLGAAEGHKVNSLGLAASQRSELTKTTAEAGGTLGLDALCITKSGGFVVTEVMGRSAAERSSMDCGERRRHFRRGVVVAEAASF